MERIKVCTNKEQSEHLVELGLGINSANMMYTPLVNFGEIPIIITEGHIHLLESKVATPAWTYSALMKVMPKLTKIGYRKSYPNIIRDAVSDKYYGQCLHYDTLQFDDPLDAAYDLICWLLVHNYINHDNETTKETKTRN